MKNIKKPQKLKLNNNNNNKHRTEEKNISTDEKKAKKARIFKISTLHH